MKAVIKTELLRQTLDRLAGIPGVIGGIEGTLLFWMEADDFGSITFTRRTVEAEISISIEAEIEEGGLLILPFTASQNACKILDEVDTAVSSNTEEGVIEFKSGDSVGFVEPWAQNNDNALIAPFDALEGQAIVLSPAELKENFSIALAAAAVDQLARSNLCGVIIRNIDKALTIGGCNGHRIHYSRIPALTIGCIYPDEKDPKKDNGLLLPTNAARFIIKSVEKETKQCNITLGQSAVEIRCGCLSIRCSVSAEIPPFYHNLLRGGSDSITVERADLLRAARAIALDGEDKDTSVILDASKQHIIVKTSPKNGAKDGSQRLVRATATKAIKMKINKRYLIDMLESMKGDSVKVTYNDHRQIYCREGDREFLALLICEVSAK